MIKALFLDIDGTLVSFETHEIPVSTIQALLTAKSKGIHIFIATGRPSAIINNLSALQQRNLIDGYITMNGGYCYVGKEVIYKSAISKSNAHALLDYCTQREIPCIVVGEHDIYVCHPDEAVKQIFHDFLKVDVLPVLSQQEAREIVENREIFQMTPFINEKEEKEVISSIPCCEINRWYPSFADVTAKGNTKQHGIDEIIRYFGIRLDETMAFGDGGNDIGMLRHAGIGVAMGNAGEEVKAAADYVTASVDEDGILKALRHFKLVED